LWDYKSTMSSLTTRRIKLIFFDMEGPIFESGVVETRAKVSASLWTALAEHLGPKCLAEEDKTKQKWMKGKYRNYFEWMEDTLKIYQKYGLDQQFFNKVIKNAKYVSGVKETIKELRRRGYAIAMVTGGFKNLANRAVVELGIHHVYAAAELFFDEKTKKLASWNLLPTDYERKVDFMRVMMEEHGFTKEECAFVGDGVNDIPLAKAAGFSIAFNGRKELQAVADVAVNQRVKNLRAILKYF